MSITEIIKQFESKLPNGATFSTSPDFYRLIGINSKRFGKLLREEIEPTKTEIQSLSKFFGVSPIQFFE